MSKYFNRRYFNTFTNKYLHFNSQYLVKVSLAMGFSWPLRFFQPHTAGGGTRDIRKSRELELGLWARI